MGLFSGVKYPRSLGVGEFRGGGNVQVEFSGPVF